MRRIYESDALVRDDEDAHAPSEGDAERSRSAVDWTNLSHALVPSALRDRAIAVSVETDRSVYEAGESVHLRVRFRNRLPFPVVLRTRSSERWTWAVDGLDRAACVPTFDPPDRRKRLTFGRSETKTFTRIWTQKVRTSSDTWESVDLGEHTLSARINVEDAEERRLQDEQTVEIR